MNTVCRSDLERMRIRSSSSLEDENRNQQSHLSRKELLKQKSDSRVAHWGDTLAAKRRTRLEWKSEKAKKEEESQRALDAQESRLKERARINLLQHADSLRLEQTEKVRNFRSQQLLVETLNGRDEQIMQKEARQKELMKEEELWHRTVMNDIQNSERKRNADLKQKRLKSIELAEDLSKQRLERERQLQIENHCKQQEEKSMIRQIADENRAAEQAQLLQRINRRDNAKAEMHQNEMILMQKREQQLKQEQEESQRCAKELERRISMSVARAQLEEEHFRQKQATRKVLSDRASHDLKERAEREFEIFERDQQLKHQRELKQAEVARKEQELARVEIDKSRKEQLHLKKQQLEGEYYLIRSSFIIPQPPSTPLC